MKVKGKILRKKKLQAKKELPLPIHLDDDWLHKKAKEKTEKGKSKKKKKMKRKSKLYELAEMIYARFQELPKDEISKRMKLIRELKIVPNRSIGKNRSTGRSRPSAKGIRH